MHEEGLNKHRIYVDETGFNLWTKRAYGRARMGERVNRVVRGQRGNNITVIVAISDQVGVLYYEVKEGGVNQEKFADFLTSLSVVIGEEEAAEAVVVMDNAPCHRRAHEWPNLSIKYLPPYSPFLNPIEECFSVFKAYLKHRLNDISAANLDNAAAARREGVPLYRRRLQQLRAAVRETLQPSVTREVVAANYQHSNTYLMSCIQLSDINH